MYIIEDMSKTLDKIREEKRKLKEEKLKKFDQDVKMMTLSHQNLIQVGVSQGKLLNKVQNNHKYYNIL